VLRCPVVEHSGAELTDPVFCDYSCVMDAFVLVLLIPYVGLRFLGSRVVSMLDSVAVATLSGNSLGKLFTPIVPLFIKQ